jgi:hypothetical protein
MKNRARHAPAVHVHLVLVHLEDGHVMHVPAVHAHTTHREVYILLQSYKLTAAM